MSFERSVFSTVAEISALQRITQTNARMLKRRADSLLSEGPWSVVNTGDVAASGDPHDFYTEGPYWWPNPDDPDGPWVKRDGEVNPAAAHQARDDCEKLGYAVVDLAVAALVFGERSYAVRVVELLHSWFVDPATAMNPHLRYGQAIPGRCNGRGIGLIDTRPFISVVEGASLLANTPELRVIYDALIEWFRSFLSWLLASKHGRDEASHGNNHSTYYWLQVAAYASFVGQEVAVEKALGAFKTELIPRQVATDGSFPREMARTRSYHYASMNLDGLVFFCELVRFREADLFSYRDARGIGVSNCFAFMEPFARRRKPWPNRDIGPAEPGSPPWLHLARYRGIIRNGGATERCNRSRMGPLYATRSLKSNYQPKPW